MAKKTVLKSKSAKTKKDKALTEAEKKKFIEFRDYILSLPKTKKETIFEVLAELQFAAYSEVADTNNHWIHDGSSVKKFDSVRLAKDLLKLSKSKK